MKRQTDFSKDFIPRGKSQKKNIFTRKPRLKKRFILRHRDSSQKMINDIEDLIEKLRFTEDDPTHPDQ
jgi:hypothetical protein